jgi:hypothetical protein
MIPSWFLASFAIFLVKAMRITWFRSASSSYMIRNLLELTTPGIFSSIKMIAFFHWCWKIPVASGTVIIAAWISDWMSASPSSEPSAQALSSLVHICMLT